MEATKAETTDNTAQSEEIIKLYRALAVAQANIILYLRNAGDNKKELKIRATEITEKLEKIIAPEQNPRGSKCGDGTVWNPITQQCE